MHMMPSHNTSQSTQLHDALQYTTTASERPPTRGHPPWQWNSCAVVGCQGAQVLPIPTILWRRECGQQHQRKDVDGNVLHREISSRDQLRWPSLEVGGIVGWEHCKVHSLQLR